MSDILGKTWKASFICYDRYFEFVNQHLVLNFDLSLLSNKILMYLDKFSPKQAAVGKKGHNFQACYEILNFVSLRSQELWNLFIYFFHQPLVWQKKKPCPVNWWCLNLKRKRRLFIFFIKTKTRALLKETLITYKTDGRNCQPCGD